MAMKILGWQDEQVSQYNPAYFVTIRAKLPSSPLNPQLKAHFKNNDLLNIAVRAKLLSDDFNQGIQWENSLEGNDIDKQVPILSSLLQSGLAESFTNTEKLIGKTTISILETLQVFKGIEPQELNLNLEFIAFKNSYLEVEAPLIALLKMSMPQLTKGVGTTILQEIAKIVKQGGSISSEDSKYLGEIPYEIILEYNNKRFSTNNSFVISNISSNRDKIQVDKRGNTIRREVSLSLKSKKSIQRDDLDIKII